ncbi:MAG: TIGR04282 family arsenosugar biosynthesis glycosyltransferase [Flavobacteriales bacterium]
MNDEDKLLMLFVKNPERGKVKTRLAETVGKDYALEIYKELLQYTVEIARRTKAHKAVFYSDHIDDNDELISDLEFNKYLQNGQDLGERMKNAFQLAFDKGFKRVIIIGSDCFELNSEIINNAFDKLNNKDVILGPAEDGGYYLLGLNELRYGLFEEMQWGTENVLLDTLIEIKKKGYSYHMLPSLSDIDTYEDLKKYYKKYKAHKAE